MIKFVARDAVATAILVLSGIAGASAIDRGLSRALDEVRGVKVTLEARSALTEGARPTGALTVVEETESAKYPFLNKRRYTVHTASSARAGTALRPGDSEDKERGDRHSEARRKNVPLKLELEGGAWRVTLAEGKRTAELIENPEPVPAPSPLEAGLLAVIAALVLYAVARIKLGPGVASLVGWTMLSGALFLSLGGLIGEASAAATKYLGAGGRLAPAVALPRIAIDAELALALGSGLILLGLAVSPLGTRLGRALAKDRGAYLAIAPAMIGMAVLVGVPFAFEVGLSFFHHSHGTFTFVGLQNFIDIIAAPGQSLFRPRTLPYSLAITLLWTALNVSLHLGLGLSLALLLRKPAAKVSRIYRVILIVPWAVPSYLTALIWRSMFDPDVGAMNRLLGTTGMAWMNDTSTAFLANLITNVWLGVPFMMVVCLGALTSIPDELYEAAEVDGASRWSQLLNITLPLLKPALLPAVILGSIWTFNKFEVIYLVSGGNPDGATDILVTEAYRWAFERGLAQGGAYGYAAAYSVVIFLVLLVYGWLTSRVARAAEEALR